MQAGLPSDQVVQAVRTKATSAVADIKQTVTDVAVRKALDVRDQQRGSWTNEDH